MRGPEAGRKATKADRARKQPAPDPVMARPDKLSVGDAARLVITSMPPIPARIANWFPSVS